MHAWRHPDPGRTQISCMLKKNKGQAFNWLSKYCFLSGWESIALSIFCATWADDSPHPSNVLRITVVVNVRATYEKKEKTFFSFFPPLTQWKEPCLGRPTKVKAKEFSLAGLTKAQCIFGRVLKRLDYLFAMLLYKKTLFII